MVMLSSPGSSKTSCESCPESPGGRVATACLVLLLPPALAAGALAALRPADAPWTLAIALVAFLVATCSTASLWPRGPLLAASVLASALLWPEMALRVAGFRFNPAGVVQFGYPRPIHFVDLETDPELFWKLSTGRADVNSEGFLGPEFTIPKPPGTFRLLFLGDSCTYQGYPAGVAGRLNKSPAALEALQAAAGQEDGLRVEALNLGIPGYTSHQGRIVAERWAARLEPDVGLILFGWNDHWQAYGAIDSDRRTGAPPAWYAKLLRHSRLVQWLESKRGSSRPEPLGLERVPLEEYRANLSTIGRRIREAGGRVVLLTAPTALYSRGVPAVQIREGFATSAERLLDLHGRYNDAVRELAHEEGWWLVDCERAASESPELDALFSEDGIHFTGEGTRWMSELLALELQRLFEAP